MLRVLFVTRAKGTHGGGMERLNEEMINAMVGAGVRAKVVAHLGPRMLAPLFILSSLPRVLKAARRVDVVHLGDPLLAVVGWVIKKILHKRVVMTVHGLDILYPSFWYQLYLGLFLSSVDTFLAISHYVAALLRDRGLGHKTTILPPGITDYLYQPHYTRKNLEQLLQCSLKGKKVIFTSGRLIPRKGHAWFISHVLSRLPPSTIYVIAGAGPERQHILEAAKTGNMISQLYVLGRIPAASLAVLSNTADAFVQPNISVAHDGEGFGLVLLEAALCQCPVFAAQLEGIPEAIAMGKNGILLPSGDASAWIACLTRFLENPEAHAPSGAQARAYTLSHYAWDRVVHTYIKVFTTAALKI